MGFWSAVGSAISGVCSCIGSAISSAFSGACSVLGHIGKTAIDLIIKPPSFDNIAFFKIVGILFDSVFYSLAVNVVLQPFLRNFLNFSKSFFNTLIDVSK